MKKKLKLARKLLSIALVMAVAFTFSFVSPKLADSTAYADETITFATNGVGNVSNGYKVEVKGASASNGMYVVEFTGESFTVPTESESVGGKFGAVDTTTKSVQYTVNTGASAEKVNADLSAITYVGSGSISITAVKQAPKSGNVYYNGNGHYYKLITEKKTWWEAMKDSMNASSDYTGYKAHPLTITSPGEMDVVKNLCGSNKIWLGAVPNGNTSESNISSGDSLPTNKSIGNEAGKGSNWIWIWNTPEAGATLPDDPTDSSGKTVCTYWHGGEPSGGTTKTTNNRTETLADTYVLCMTQSGENVLWDDLDKTVATSWDDYKTMCYIIEYSPYDTEGSKWAGDKNNTNAVKAMSDTYSSANVKEDAGVTITSAPASKTYGGADFTVTASKTAGDGGKWTWTSSNPQVLKIVSGGNAETATVQVLKADATGATLTAKYESNTYLGSATTEAITVAQKEVTVAAGTYKVSKAYDGTTNAGTATGTLSVNGIVGSEATVTATPVAYTNANVGGQSTMNVGITLTGDGSANYKIKDNATAVSVPCEITKAKVSGTPAFTKVSETGKKLSDVLNPSNVSGLTPADGTFAWALGNDTEVVKGTAYTWTYTPTDNANYEVLTGSYTPWATSYGSYGGSSSSSSSSKLEAAKNEAKADVKTQSETQKYENTEAAEVKAIKEQADRDIAAAKTVEEVEKIKAEAEAQIEAIPTAAEKADKKAVQSVNSKKLKATSKRIKKNGKTAVKLTWNAPSGVKLDGYVIYRSVKKSTLGKKVYDTTTKTTYTNAKYIKKGNTYYYKVKGYKTINGEKVYTGWSTTAYRTIK